MLLPLGKVAQALAKVVVFFGGRGGRTVHAYLHSSCLPWAPGPSWERAPQGVPGSHRPWRLDQWALLLPLSKASGWASCPSFLVLSHILDDKALHAQPAESQDWQRVL